MIILTCSNCGYEVNELTVEENLCQTCWRAYERGKEAMARIFNLDEEESK